MNSEEQALRSLIREGIRIVYERKRKQNLKEQRLRNVIRHFINEVAGKTSVADKVIHKSTGINVLDGLFKRIITQIEDAYTNLSSNDKQRKSFRYHFLINFKNALAPIDANREAPAVSGETEGILTEQDFKIEVEQDDIASAPDKSKFLPSRPQDIAAAKEEEEKEEEDEAFIKLDTADPDVQQGAAAAENAWNDVENQIISAYERLINPEDAHAFKDWGLTNLKLYFDKFEDEMAEKLGSEPTSPDYPPEDESTLKEVIYNI
tara:strand:+ start:1563 stop:2351 length:789 start_codon:yes stop_codon:yes gene_type:complete